VALGHLAEIHFPKAITCGFETAAHSLHDRQSMAKIRTNIGTNIGEVFRGMMMEEWHGGGNRRNDD
jgi:hypothetical protein